MREHKAPRFSMLLKACALSKFYNFTLISTISLWKYRSPRPARVHPKTTISQLPVQGIAGIFGIEVLYAPILANMRAVSKSRNDS